jgi:hypothetical protein
MNRTCLLALLALTGCLNGGFKPYYGDDQGAPSIATLEYEKVAGTVGGQTLRISGENFGNDTNAVTVIFGDQNARVIAAEDTVLTVEVPRGPLQGGAVRLAVGTLEGQDIVDPAFYYEGSAAEINESAYLHVSNDYFSCLAGIGASGTALIEDPATGEVSEEQVGTFCDTFAYTGALGLSGRAEFIEFAFPRMHTPFVGDKAGFAGAADQSLGEWAVMAPGQEFNSFDIQGLYEDRQIEVGSFTLTNPVLADDTFCLDESLLSTYTYAGGDPNPEGGVYAPRTFSSTGLLDAQYYSPDEIDDGAQERGETPECADPWAMEVPADQIGFCQLPDYDDVYNFQYDASWLSGSYFFADDRDWQSQNPRELGPPTVVLDIPGDASDFAMRDLSVTLPEYAFFDAVQGAVTEGGASFEGSSGLFLKDDACFDGDGDGVVGRDDPAYTFTWRPATPYRNSDFELDLSADGVDERIKGVNYYVQATVSVLTAGWLGGEGVTVRAVITVPDTNDYDPDTGLSSLVLPNWVWYSLPSVYQDYGSSGFGAVQWGSPYRSDYGQLFLTLDRVAEFEIEAEPDEFGNERSLVFSYSTGNMGLQPLFGGDDTVNNLDKGECGDCLDQDGDGWADSEDPDCTAYEIDPDRPDRQYPCDDGADNDRDGLVDLEDPDCYELQTEDGFDTRYQCNDGRDNDRDGFIDSEDPDCDSARDTNETGPDCADGADNDEDGWVDRRDPDCFDNPTGSEAGFDDTLPCNDDADNDGDGWFDADDPDCNNAEAEEEGFGATTCNDGIDNDGDGWIDSADTDCSSAVGDEDGADVTSDCSDGLDGDDDGWFDAEDPDCLTGADTEVGFGADSCNDGADDDSDTWADRDDPDCVTATDAEVGVGVTECNDGIDNDLDELIDNADPECENAEGSES